MSDTRDEPEPASTTAGTPPSAKPGTFPPGNPGRPKGIIDARVKAGLAGAKELEPKAWEVLTALLEAKKAPVRYQAAKLVLAYACGQPRMLVDLEAGAQLREVLIAAFSKRAPSAPAPAPEPHVEPV